MSGPVPRDPFSPAELALALTMARVLRNLLMKEARSGSRAQWIADLHMLNEAMRPFEPASLADVEDGVPP
jgi:hypothetical protein